MSLFARSVSSALRSSISLAARKQAPRAAFSVMSIKYGGGAPEPYVGPGGPVGKIPSDLEQSTGLERHEYISMLEGKEAFDTKPLEMTHMGTPQNPIVVKSVDPERLVGCTGYPADSHDTLWLVVKQTKGVDRCPECGCCYQLKPHH